MDDDAELREMVKKALEGKGVLAQLRVRKRIESHQRTETSVLKIQKCLTVYRQQYTFTICLETGVKRAILGYGALCMVRGAHTKRMLSPIVLLPVLDGDCAYVKCGVFRPTAA